MCKKSQRFSLKCYVNNNYITEPIHFFWICSKIEDYVLKDIPR